MTENQFFLSLGYLANLRRESLIEAEIPAKSRINFENKYSELTNNYLLPPENNKAPYYVWSEDADKWGVELRIYFIADDNLPDYLRSLTTIQNRQGYDDYNMRINNNNFIERLFAFGFVLGDNQNIQRIRNFIRNIDKELIDQFEIGFNL